MKQGGVKKKKKAESKFVTVKINRKYYDKVKANKDINRTPISAFIEMAIDEKLERQ
jgi:hypothetical protein